jgi:lysine-ketoglutarate reductase/saccharopine dehydrogenase-like protein (TIGR00300 family)
MTPPSNPSERFLMCRPAFYGVEYVINPWMEGNVGRARRAVAARQWETLHRALAARAAVECIEPAPELPDMTFAANAGLVLDDLFVPARFRFPQRQPEVQHFGAWFRARGFRLVELPDGSTFEGEGDALFQPGEPLLWGGYGVRTSLDVYRHLAAALAVEIVPLRLVDERFYHLDTCFCPLPGGRVLYYADAFDAGSLAVITSRVPPDKRCEVSTADGLQFACNAVVVGATFVTNFASDSLKARLAAWGYTVETCPLAEFILAGGSAKCLALHLTHDLGTEIERRAAAVSGVCERVIELQGHLLDRGLMNQALDCITDGGGSFVLEAFQPGLRHDQRSWTRLRVIAPTPARLDAIVGRLMQQGARVADEEADARLEPVRTAGVAPPDFYGTTIFPTEVRVRGHWVRAEEQRMDAALVVDDTAPVARVSCRLLRDLDIGDRVVCGLSGVRVHPLHPGAAREPFAFMGAQASSERRVELAVERIAWEMRRLRERGRRIVVVAGPVVIHTGGGPHLASLIRRGYVQALLGGNGLAAHDIESAMFGTSLGVDIRHGGAAPGGHQHHLRAINVVRACGGIAAAVEQGVLRGGVMYECVRRDVPFALAGSIRDDGPLPETMMDLIEAQAAYARLIRDAGMILMLASMLHSIGVGNMTRAGVRLICVDISPAAVTKLTDRGSLEAVGLVTDVGSFLNLLDTALSGDGDIAAPAGAREPG